MFYILSTTFSLSATTRAEVPGPTNIMRVKMVVNRGLIMCEHQYSAKIVVRLKSDLRDYFTMDDLF
jgi:hypothetical protein